MFDVSAHEHWLHYEGLDNVEHLDRLQNAYYVYAQLNQTFKLFPDVVKMTKCNKMHFNSSFRHVFEEAHVLERI